MNTTKQFIACASVLLALATSPVLAAPGAHGPNGEHLDAPSAGASGGSAPRIEAKSEMFELVGVLQGGELSILINRFETNEPVLNASVEVESGSLKAKAPYHADHGDYAVADEAFLKTVGKPGAHPLVITVTSGSDADLLDGTLNVPQEADANGHDHGVSLRTKVAGGLLGAVLAATALRFLRRRRTRSVDSTGSAA